MNKVSISLYGKLTVFIANDKIQAFKQKLEFWKTCYLPEHFDSFLITEDFSDKWLVILTCVFFGTV